jgi:LysM repeat protein
MPLFVVHKVTSGDTLSDLAAEYFTSVDAIQAVNGLATPNLVQPDQELNIPVGLVTALKIECAKSYMGKLDNPSGLAVYLRSNPAYSAAMVSFVIANHTPLQVLGQQVGTDGEPWYKVNVAVTTGGYRIGWLPSLWVTLENGVTVKDIPSIGQ